MEENLKKSGNKKDSNKYQIKDMRKFLLSVVVILVIVIAVIVIVVTRKVNVNDSTKLDSLNASKYTKELADEYNRNGEKEKFLEDYDKVQTQVAMYILNNSTLDDNSFDVIKSNLQTELNKKEWKNFDLEKPTHWNGEWSVDITGTVKFKFKTKDIEPNWVNDNDLVIKIIKN